ncbi:hypothetical protein CF319_g8138 [Tilletia indica]|nr:hypothetical protein CF319_g8138 [Tilletia indica]
MSKAARTFTSGLPMPSSLKNFILLSISEGREHWKCQECDKRFDFQLGGSNTSMRRHRMDHCPGRKMKENTPSSSKPQAQSGSSAGAGPAGPPHSANAASASSSHAIKSPLPTKKTPGASGDGLNVAGASTSKGSSNNTLSSSPTSAESTSGSRPAAKEAARKLREAISALEDQRRQVTEAIQPLLISRSKIDERLAVFRAQLAQLDAVVRC